MKSRNQFFFNFFQKKEMPSKRDREPEETIELEETIALEETASQPSDHDDDALLKEFHSSSSEGENSSDDEQTEPTIQSLMTPQDTAKALKKKPLVSIKSEPGVIYLGRIPHGFYEEEMESYFSQFGQVCRLRLSRNKKVNFFLPISHCADGKIKTLCFY